MKTVYSAAVVAMFLVSPISNAQTCFGGVDGGMDASGSQCNFPESATASDTERQAVPRNALYGAARTYRLTPDVEMLHPKSALSAARPTTHAHPSLRVAGAVRTIPPPRH